MITFCHLTVQKNHFDVSIRSKLGWLLSCVAVALSGCGGGSSTSAGGAAVASPIFYDIAPSSLRVGVASTLAVTGANLPLTATLTLSSGTCAAATGNTANGFSIVCTPGSATLGASGTVWSAAPASGGWWLGQKLLTVTAAVVSPLAPLNDTGLGADQCLQAGTNTLVGCASAAAIALNDKQDGMLGRDVEFPSNTDGIHGTSLAYLGASTDCVKDQVTGLTWQRASTTLTALPGRPMSDEASGLASAANAGSLCGLTNWRLPSRLELQGMVLFNAPYSGAVGATNMSWFPATLAAGYYSGSSYQPNSANNRWVVDFTQGSTVTLSGLASSVQLRLVSGDAAAPATRFTVSTDGTEVTDALTGLVWRRCSEGQTWSGTTCTGPRGGFTHEEALTHAKTQGQWRLPNVKELSSLTDSDLYNPSINTTVFITAPAAIYWSATPAITNGSNTSAEAWAVDFLGGSVAPLARSTSTGFVRLVR